MRRLADVLEVDAVVVGAVTDYSPYYPPRCGMRVEWYARNPGFHEIPAGYGLPWGTPDEEFIPAPLVFEAELALAKAQLATQSPNCAAPPTQRSQRDRHRQHQRRLAGPGADHRSTATTWCPALRREGHADGRRTSKPPTSKPPISKSIKRAVPAPGMPGNY